MISYRQSSLASLRLNDYWLSIGRRTKRTHYYYILLSCKETVYLNGILLSF